MFTLTQSDGILFAGLCLLGFLDSFFLIPIVAKTSQRRCLCCTKTCHLYWLPSINFSSKRMMWHWWRNVIIKGCTNEPSTGSLDLVLCKSRHRSCRTILKSSETICRHAMNCRSQNSSSKQFNTQYKNQSLHCSNWQERSRILQMLLALSSPQNSLGEKIQRILWYT